MGFYHRLAFALIKVGEFMYEQVRLFETGKEKEVEKVQIKEKGKEKARGTDDKG